MKVGAWRVMDRTTVATEKQKNRPLVLLEKASEASGTERASMINSRDCQVPLTFNCQADTETQFREDSTPFHVLGSLNVPNFGPFIVSCGGRLADMQCPVWSCNAAGVPMLGGAPRTHAEPEASRTKAASSCLSQARGSPRHHLLPQGAARCKDERPKSACLVWYRNKPIWMFRLFLWVSRNLKVQSTRSCTAVSDPETAGCGDP